MKIPSPRTNKRARIEIIPLIDIVFFLLATFVMVSLSMVKNLGIPLQLPKASSGTAQDRESQVSISVDTDGRLFYNKELISMDNLVLRLKGEKEAKADLKVFINGDAGTRFQNVVDLLDETRKLGISKVAIETVRK